MGVVFLQIVGKSFRIDALCDTLHHCVQKRRAVRNFDFIHCVIPDVPKYTGRQACSEHIAGALDEMLVREVRHKFKAINFIIFDYIGHATDDKRSDRLFQFILLHNKFQLGAFLNLFVMREHSRKTVGQCFSLLRRDERQFYLLDITVLARHQHCKKQNFLFH